MKELIVPEKLHAGDRIALISISGGRAGDEDMLPRYQIGKRRLEEIFGLEVVETPHALRGSTYLYEHPEKRGEDLMWALKDPNIKGIICNMGGDDSYRVLPYIDPEVIRANPKVFMGFSDIATWMAVFLHAGVRAYYGPNLLTPIAQIGGLDEYTRSAIQRTLFSNEIIGEIKPCERHTPIEWRDIAPEEIPWTTNTGYKILQGKGTIEGNLIAICGGPLWQIMGTSYFPKKDTWKDAIIALEHDAIYDSPLAGLHQLRAFAAAGIFNEARAILTGPLDSKSEETILKVIDQEVHREDLVIVENVDYIHRTPMTILPTGARTAIDCDKRTITILESGVC